MLPDSSALSRGLLSASLRNLIGQVLSGCDLSSGVLGRVVSRPPRVATVGPREQGGCPRAHKTTHCGGLV